MATHSFLLEIGTEELPAHVAPEAMEQLREAVSTRMVQARLVPEGTKFSAAATPRRLAVACAGVRPRQPDHVDEFKGPAVAVAYDANGNPTKAAEGFARGKGVAVERLVRRKDGDTEHVVALVADPGRPAAEVLPGILTAAIGSLSFKKSMRWGDTPETFARPIRWIVAVLEGQTIPFTYAGVAAGDTTRGHRFWAPKPVKVRTFADYVETLQEARVVVDPVERRQRIQTLLQQAAREAKWQLVPDDDLLDTVTYLVEEPSVTLGSFDVKYLQLPPELLVTLMRTHQKYFAVRSEAGAIQPFFLTVNSTKVKDPAVVRHGNERVLRARLADANHFHEVDRRSPLASRVEQLEGQQLHGALGTYLDKTARVRKWANHWGAALGLASPDLAALDRAAELCKADLRTAMVYEFPELQGVMGRHYARLDGEPGAVAEAIYEHYQPKGMADPVPPSAPGAVLAVADKLDTLVAFFCAGLHPKASGDPYGLRRACLGVIRILIDRGWTAPWGAHGEAVEGWVTEMLAHPYIKAKGKPAEIAAALGAFIHDRVYHYFAGEAPASIVQAVWGGEAASGAGALLAHLDLKDVAERLAALRRLHATDAFEPIAAAFKRATGIVRKEAAAFEKDSPGQVPPWRTQPVDETKLTEAAEIALHQAIGEFGARIAKARDSRQYDEALKLVAGQLRGPVDAFFDQVLVNAPDAGVRANRLAMLSQLSALFDNLADFTLIQG